jgi:Nanos RNA binding domain
MNANRNNKNMKKAAPKPYCKVCHDAGKTEVEYTSHWVKTKPGPDGVVVCPTLLAQECRYCHEMGHTPSCCKKLERDNKARAKEEHERERAKRTAQHEALHAKKKPVPQVAKCGGGFAALVESSDSDESPRARPVEEFPALCSAPRSLLLDSAIPAAGSYASMAIKSKMQFDLEQTQKENERLRAELAAKKSVTYVVATPKPRIPASKLNWADMDSDSSDDEDW